MQQNLTDAIQRLEEAHVSTIHGFCADLLARTSRRSVRRSAVRGAHRAASEPAVRRGVPVVAARAAGRPARRCAARAATQRVVPGRKEHDDGPVEPHSTGGSRARRMARLHGRVASRPVRPGRRAERNHPSPPRTRRAHLVPAVDARPAVHRHRAGTGAEPRHPDGGAVRRGGPGRLGGPRDRSCAEPRLPPRAQGTRSHVRPVGDARRRLVAARSARSRARSLPACRRCGSGRAAARRASRGH